MPKLLNSHLVWKQEKKEKTFCYTGTRLKLNELFIYCNICLFVLLNSSTFLLAPFFGLLCIAVFSCSFRTLPLFIWQRVLWFAYGFLFICFHSIYSNTSASPRKPRLIFSAEQQCNFRCTHICIEQEKKKRLRANIFFWLPFVNVIIRWREKKRNTNLILRALHTFLSRIIFVQLRQKSKPFQLQAKAVYPVCYFVYFNTICIPPAFFTVLRTLFLTSYWSSEIKFTSAEILACFDILRWNG